MNRDAQSLGQVKQELVERIDATRIELEQKIDDTRIELEQKIDAVVDQTRVQLEQKIDAVDRRVDQTRVQLEQKIDGVTTLVGATALGLERRLTKVIDGAVDRGLGLIYGRVQIDAAVLSDKIGAVERALNEHVANERIHQPRTARRR